MAQTPPTPTPKKGIVGWIDHRLPVFSFMDHELSQYPTPKNLNIWWNFGSLAGIMLMIMIVTGIFLAMNYTANTQMAFNSVERIMRDVNGGWIIRYLHMNGASMFFIVVYIHIFRGLYYGSYKAPRELLWALGVAIFLIMMATAFMGYVLPWGQMSLWGAEVITNFFSAIPVVGEDLVQLTRGSFAVDNPTLTRFFALHYLMPFLIVGLVVLHLVALHRFGSNNPKGIDITSPKDKISFHPYYTLKDLVGLGVFLLFYSAFVFFAPDYLGHPDNYIPANPLQTPAHIVPEWYFLPFYAILRAIDFDIPLILFTINSKLAGVLAMFASVLVLFFLPWLDRHPVRSARFRPWYKIVFWLFLVNAIVLGYIGSQPPSGNMIVIGQAATAWYFLHFFVLLPLLSKYEPVATLPKTLDEPTI